METMLRIGWDDEDLSGGEGDGLIGRQTVPVATDNHTNAVGRVGVLGLVGVGGNVEEIEAGIAPADRGDEERVGAAIDVAKAPLFFDGATEMEEAGEAFVGHTDSRSPGDPGGAGNGGIHPGVERVLDMIEFQSGRAISHIEKMGAVRGELQGLVGPAVKRGGEGFCVGLFPAKTVRSFDGDERIWHRMIWPRCGGLGKAADDVFVDHL